MTTTRAGLDETPPGTPASPARSSFITPITVFVILVIGIILITLLVFQQEQRALLRETEDRLSAISRLQATRLSMWRRERLADASVLAADRTLGHTASALLRHPADGSRQDDMRHALDAMKWGYGYYSVHILDDSAQVRAHATGDLPVVGYRIPALIRQVHASKRPLMTDFHIDSVKVPVTHLDILVPLDLAGAADIPPLYLLLRVDPIQFLFPFLEAMDSSQTTPGSEFIRYEGGSVDAFIASADKEHKAGWQTFATDSTLLPEVRAGLGERGFFRATDHHGKRVYAYASDVPGMPWAVLALLPEEVIQNPLRARAQTMSVFVLLFTLASAFAVVFLWSRDLKASRERERESHAKLRESQDLYHHLFEGMYQGVLYLDSAGVILDANPAARRLLQSPEILDHRPPLRTLYHSVIHEDGTPFRPEQLPTAIVQRTGMPVLDVTAGIRLQESSPILWHIISAFPLKREGEMLPGHTLMVFEDITDRRAVIERLRESESLNRNLVEHLPLRIFVKDRGSRYVSCNASFAEDLGITPNEIAGKTDFDFFPHELAVEYHTKDRVVLDEHRPLDVQEEYRLPGRSRWIRVIKVPYRDPRGTVIGLLGMFEDITERRLAEEIRSARLRLTDYARDHSTEELLQETLDEVCLLTGSPIGFYHFMEADQKTLSLQAWSTRTLKEFCHAEGKGAHYALDEAGVWIDCARERRPVIHNDYMALTHRKGLPPGHAHVQRELAVPIFRGGLIVAILGIGNKEVEYAQQDIDTVVQFADMAWDVAEVKRAEERLKSSLREKEVLLKEVHHRVKNNLQVISSLLNLQSARVADPAVRAAFVASQTRVRSMALIHEKLYRSEMLAGIDFGDYLRTVTNDLIRFYSIGHVAVEMATEAVHLPVDTAIPCGLIVNELISNALKHAFPGGAEGKMYVTVRRVSPSEVELIVEDTGCGMPAHMDPRTMTSMGMTLVTSLTEQIGGTFSLTVPHGTRIAIRFPG